MGVEKVGAVEGQGRNHVDSIVVGDVIVGVEEGRGSTSVGVALDFIRRRDTIEVVNQENSQNVTVLEVGHMESL